MVSRELSNWLSPLLLTLIPLLDTSHVYISIYYRGFLSLPGVELMSYNDLYITLLSFMIILSSIVAIVSQLLK